MYQKKSRSFVKHLDFMFFDLLVMEFTYIISYVLRHGWENPYADSKYFEMAGVLLLIQFLVVTFRESYSDILRRGYLVEAKNVIVQNTIIIMLAFTFMFLTKQTEYSRKMFLQIWLLSIVFMYGERLVWKNRIRDKLRKNDEQAHMLVISEANELERAIRKLQEKKYQYYKVDGAIIYRQNAKGRRIAGVPVVADWDEIFEYTRKSVVDEVFLNIRESDATRKNIVERFLEMGITVHINLGWEQSELPNKSVQNLGNYSVLTTSIKTATVYQMFMKRSMDIAGSLVGLVCTGILFLIFAPVIYIQSPGPVFFSQVRVGRNGRKFRIYKFRSMYMDAEERKKELMEQNKMSGLMFKMDDDPRIIPIGHLIRKLSIDEFPQFWNVLKGDMSLVGTRPPTVDEFEQYEAHHKVRLAIKPGLTGMWQVSGRSDITDFEEVVRLDNQYIEEWNLKLDIKILCRTVAVVLGKKGSV